jgi:hypothetical protein
MPHSRSQRTNIGPKTENLRNSNLPDWKTEVKIRCHRNAKLVLQLGRELLKSAPMTFIRLRDKIDAVKQMQLVGATLRLGHIEALSNR